MPRRTRKKFKHLLKPQERRSHNSRRSENPPQASTRSTSLAKKLPNEIWDAVRGFATPFFTGLLFREFKIHPPAEHAHNAIWYEIFRDERWLKYVTSHNAHPGLLGPDLGTDPLEGRRNITLLLANRQDIDSRNLFFESLRPCKKVGNGYEVDIGRIRLNVGVIKKHPYIRHPFPGGNTTWYCFWTDLIRTQKKIEALDVHAHPFLPEHSLVNMRLATHDMERDFQYLFTHEKIYWT
jgi:hypothetical protein